MKIKKTKKLIKQLQPYWKMFRVEEREFEEHISNIEKEMEKATGIKDIEFFHCDGEIMGIGNVSRNMELIRFLELEKGKIINYD